MNLNDQVNQILIDNGLMETPEPPEPSEEVENDPYDDVECPECGCNAWDVYGREKSREIKKRGEHGKRIRVLRRVVPLRCGNKDCGNQWKLTILEDI